MHYWKICTGCGKKKKGYFDFYKHPNSKDGLQSQCKDCNHLACLNYSKSGKRKLRRENNKHYTNL